MPQRSAQIADLFPDCLDVALMQRDFVLVGLQTLLNLAATDRATLHALVWQDDRFLLAEILFRLLGILLFGRQLAFEDTPTIAIARLLRLLVPLESCRVLPSWLPVPWAPVQG